jgi:kynureninase
MALDAAALDDADALAAHRDRFLPMGDVVAYLDGNSLGRPLAASAARIGDFLDGQWGARLIRGWDEGWLDLPLRIGDELGRVTLGAAAGQTTIGDSTTVLLYKLIRAAVDATPGRDELVIDRDNFPTDRYVAEGVAAERGLTIRWIDDATGVDAVLGPRTALVVLSHVSYRSGALADAAGITARVHDAGALILWDLCHSTGVVPLELDAWGVDLAVGCTYKYLNGGPGSPALAYVAARHQALLRQPIQGWLGSAAPFEMGQGYVAAEGIRGFLSGTPPIVGMLAIEDTLALLDEVGLDAVRAKSVALTSLSSSPTGSCRKPRSRRRATRRRGAATSRSTTTASPPSCRACGRAASSRTFGAPTASASGCRPSARASPRSSSGSARSRRSSPEHARRPGVCLGGVVRGSLTVCRHSTRTCSIASVPGPRAMTATTRSSPRISPN